MQNHGVPQTEKTGDGKANRASASMDPSMGMETTELGEPKEIDAELLITGNKINKTPCPTHFMFCLLFVFFACSFSPFGDQALHRDLCLQSGEQTGTVKTRFPGLSSTFHFPSYNIPSLWTSFKFSFPSHCMVPPGQRKEAIGGMFLRIIRKEQRSRGPSLPRWAAPLGPT